MRVDQRRGGGPGARGDATVAIDPESAPAQNKVVVSRLPTGLEAAASSGRFGNAPYASLGNLGDRSFES